MSCPMPEIGSCISLISKADIRYEGLLFTVDPDRCTIALARVKSYGTEDRETQFPIAPQNQCYDYILFRGSDIKDIRVINNNPVPNDPAIMQMHLPPQQQLPPMQNKLGQPGFQPQPGGFMMPQMGGPGGPGGPMGGPPPGHQPMGPAYSSFGGINNLGDLIGGGGGAGTGGSRSTTPSNLLSRKSPTVDMGVQTNQQQQQQGGSGQNNREGNRSGGDGGNLERGNNQRNRNNSQRNNNQQQGGQQQRERRDSGKNDGQMKENFNKNMQNRQGGGNQNRGWNNNRGNNQNQNNNMRGRPRGPRGPPQGGNNRAKNLLKFENDYDFEQANNKFEELRSQLSKLKVGDEVKPEQLNSETIDKKDDSGNETGAGEHEPEEDEGTCYDKTKSFFDNISCEAIERAKGKQQRTDWRQERKLNTETFGVGSTRRGGYNRRGGYYNRGPNNYRGNNQYRGGNNYRGRSGNRNNQPNGLPHNGNNNGRNNQQPQQQQQQQQQQSSQSSQQQQQPAAIEVAAGK